MVPAAGSAAPPANPFAGARGYVDPDWSAAARATAAQGGELGPAMRRRPVGQGRLAGFDRVDERCARPARTAGPPRRGARSAVYRGGRPAGDRAACVRPAPAGAARARPAGSWRTRPSTGGTQFIDPIAAILAEPAYRRLRVAVVVEPDALANALYSHFECAQAGAVYRDAIPYALGRLHETPNVQAYLDVTQSNQLGWLDSLQAAVAVVRELVDRTPAGVESIDGFAVNVADYDPVDEPFLDVGMTRNGVSIKQTKWVDWNNHLEESTFVDALHAALVAAGFPERIGALLDTSRNGWGGPVRPTAVSTSSDINTFVDQSRVDRRPASLSGATRRARAWARRREPRRGSMCTRTPG